MNVEANIERDLDGVFQGILTVGNPTCFNSGMLSGSLANTSVSMTARGNGTASQTTYVQITGELSGNTITGLFSMTSQTAECTIDKAALTITR